MKKAEETKKAKKCLSMREAFGEALVELGEKNKDVVVLDADVSKSTKTVLFGKAYPDRFFNIGVAEGNMVDIAAGLSLTGKIPFVSSFSAIIILRALDHIRTTIAYPKLNVKVIGSYSGLSDSKDGPTHQSISDIAIMRSIPNMTVLVAADAIEARKAVFAIAEYKGPVYLRVCRADVPTVSDENHKLNIGKGVWLKKGKDAVIITTGIMVSKSLEVSESLKKKGIDVGIVEIHTIKPIDEDIIIEATKISKNVITVEEHSIVGGLGSAVCEVVCKHNPVSVYRVGINDTFTESGDYNGLLEKYGLGVNTIAEIVEGIVKK